MTERFGNEGKKMNGETNLKSCVLMSIFLLGIECTGVAGRTIYVDDDGPADFNTIQAAIDDSNDGDTVIVQRGLYEEDINFLGKNIVLTGVNPTKPDTVAETIIGGNDGNEVTVMFRGTEDPNCILSGFNINGFIKGYEVIYDSNGLLIPSSLLHTHATISNCLLEGNHGNCGTVIIGCDGTISNCVIVDNKDPHCLYTPEFPPFAIGACHGMIKNCTIANNTGGRGIEVFNGETTIQNCVLSNNNIITLGIGTKVNIMYSNVNCGIYGDVNLGPGNIDTDPCFVRAGYWEYYEQDWIYFEGDYHLKSQAGRWDPNSESWEQDEVTSPCIDAGDPVSPIGYELFPNGGIINMGAYGGTVDASKSYFGQPVCETIVAGDINGDCIVNYKDFALMALNWLRDENQ